jgi:hypothetical protein
MITKKRLQKLLESANYRFAKKMPQYPHCYTLRETWSDDEEFKQAIEGIWHYGKAEDWHGRTFVYFYAGEYKYWTMGKSECEVLLINRAHA